MAITLPIGIRVTAGLLGTAIDRLGSLPKELPTLGITVAGQILRTSMRVRQEIAELATRGDDLLSGLTGGMQENPAWATFDEDEDEPALSHPAGRTPPGQGPPADTTATAQGAAAVAEHRPGHSRTQARTGPTAISRDERTADRQPTRHQPTERETTDQQSADGPATGRDRKSPRPAVGRQTVGGKLGEPAMAQVGQPEAAIARRGRGRVPADTTGSGPSPVSEINRASRAARAPRTPPANRTAPRSAENSDGTAPDAGIPGLNNAHPPVDRNQNIAPAPQDNAEVPVLEAKPSRKRRGPNRVSVVQDRVDAPSAPVTRPSATRNRVAGAGTAKEDLPKKDIPSRGRTRLTGVPTSQGSTGFPPTGTDLPITGPTGRDLPPTSTDLLITGPTGRDLPPTSSAGNAVLGAAARQTALAEPPDEAAAESPFIPGAPIPDDHPFSISELKERLQDRDIAAVRILLDQEQSGPNRAAYLTLLGNRLMTLEHRDS